jgi:hypothetical protein
MTERSNSGVAGAFVFAIGATIILFIAIVSFGAINNNQNPIIPPFIFIAFLGFLLVGLGLHLIVQAKSETKQTPSPT